MNKLIYIIPLLFVWGTTMGQITHFPLLEKSDDISNLKNHFDGTYSLIDAQQLNKHIQSIKTDSYSFNFSFSIDGQNVELNMFLSDVVSDDTRITSVDKEIMFIKDFGIKSFKGYTNNSEKVNAYLVINDEYFLLNFKLNGKNYTFQPANYLMKQWAEGFSDYVLYESKNLKGDDKKYKCGVPSSINNVKYNNNITNMVDNDCKQINLASASDIHMVNSYGSTQNVITYLTEIYLGTALAFDDEFSYELDLRIVEYYISNSSNEFWPNETNASILIDNMDSWGGFSSNHQFKQLFTDRNIFAGDGSDALGLAELGGTISIIEDWFFSIGTVVHELGHNLNCVHDPESSNTVMNPVSSFSLRPWSNLSINSVNNHVANNQLFPTCPHTWVDYNVNFNGSGSFNSPYDNLGSAVNNVLNNGTIRIKSSTGDAPGVFINVNKNFKIESWNGSALIGQ